MVSLMALALLVAAPRASARTLAWSGYQWDVRPGGVGGPGPNRWSDSEANARVEGSELVLSILKDAQGRWTSSEVDNQQHLGYGTYRWVVNSDLSTIDAYDVVGMFVWGDAPPSNNEIDIEAAHWGNLAWPSGSGTVWQDFDADKSKSKSFDYSAHPPYVNQFTWAPGSVAYRITDGTGNVLFEWTLLNGVPTPSVEVPIVNFWRFEDVAPSSARSVRLSSFSWAPLGHEDELPPAPVAPAAPIGRCAGAAETSGTAARIAALRMSPRRVAVHGRRRGTTIRWSASEAGRLRLLVRRHVNRRFVTVGALKRAVPAGTGRLRWAGRVGGRRLLPGRYRLVASLRTGGVDCGPQRLGFRVLRG